MLDDDRLRWWIENRIGYGNLQAPFWFIGLEEACGAPAEIEARIQGDAVEDLYDAHTRIGGYARLFDGERPTIQRTWRGLINLLLATLGSDGPDREAVRHYQAREFGRSAGRVLLAEIFPLPSPGRNRWTYDNLSRIPALSNREDYHETFGPGRVQLLRNLYREHRPPIVVAYGTGEWPRFKGIFEEFTGHWAPLDMPKRSGWGLIREIDGAHVVTLMPHPIYESNANLHGLGGRLRRFVPHDPSPRR